MTISEIIAFIEGTILPFGAFGIFLAAFIEEVIVPIPSALVLMTSGFVFLSGIAFPYPFVPSLLFFVALPAALGMTLGSLFIYTVAYLFGKPALDRFGRFLGFNWGDIERTEVRLSGSGFDEILLVVFRIFPFVPSAAVNALCGLLRLSLKKYITLTLIGTFFRALLLASLGAFLGDLYGQYAVRIDRASDVIFLGLVVSTISFCLIQLLRYQRRLYSKK